MITIKAYYFLELVTSDMYFEKFVTNSCELNVVIKLLELIYSYMEKIVIDRQELILIIKILGPKQKQKNK